MNRLYANTLICLCGAVFVACAGPSHSIPSAPITGVAVGTAAANDILAADVSKTLATTTATQEAINPAAVVSSTYEPASREVALSAPPLEQSIGGVENHVSAALPPEPVYVPVSPVQPAATKPSGHWESYGFRGRRSRWVSDSPQQVQSVRYYSSGGCANGRCGR